MSNSLQQCWSNNGKALNGWLSSPSPFHAEIMGMQNFESITIDLQHGLVEYRDAVLMMQAMSNANATMMCRIPWLEPGIIMKMLDAGAMGIICPMINTAEQAHEFVGATRYAPDGYRSSGPIRAGLLQADYHTQANKTIASLAMIETFEAVGNAEAICATEGLTGIYVGPSDLAISMGEGPGLDRPEGLVKDTIKNILKIAKSAGIKACIHCGSPAYIREMYELGFDLCTLNTDIRIFAQAVSNQISEVKS